MWLIPSPGDGRDQNPLQDLETLGSSSRCRLHPLARKNKRPTGNSKCIKLSISRLICCEWKWIVLFSSDCPLKVMEGKTHSNHFIKICTLTRHFTLYSRWILELCRLPWKEILDTWLCQSHTKPIHCSLTLIRTTHPPTCRPMWAWTHCLSLRSIIIIPVFIKPWLCNLVLPHSHEL